MKAIESELKNFLRKNIPGHTSREVSEMVKNQLNIDFSSEKVKGFKNREHIKSETPRGLPKGRATETYPKEIKEFIDTHYRNTGPKDMAAALNLKFGKEYSAHQIKGYYANHDLNSGVSGYFEKGRQSQYKGMKGLRIPGSEKGWFKKGDKPHNAVPVGTETIDVDGYHKLKIAEPDIWMFAHKLVWMKNFGDIPEKMRVSFKDGDRDNLDPNNLMLISSQEHLVMVRKGLRFRNAEYTEIGLTIARVHLAAQKRKAGAKKQSRS